MATTNSKDALPGNAPDPESQVLETGANALQSFAPINAIHAHLNAFHTPFHAPGSVAVETNHYCAHPRHDIRQCVLYDSDAPDARLIGVEYMVTPELFATLPADEKPLWHSHVFEVRSGMLVMPQGLADRGVPGARQAWETAETREMGQVVRLYGKVWQTWDMFSPGKSTEVPLGEPVLMTSFTEESQLPDFEKLTDERDRKFGTDWRRKKELRKDVELFEPDERADGAWKRRSSA